MPVQALMHAASSTTARVRNGATSTSGALCPCQIGSWSAPDTAHCHALSRRCSVDVMRADSHAPAHLILALTSASVHRQEAALCDVTLPDAAR